MKKAKPCIIFQRSRSDVGYSIVEKGNLLFIFGMFEYISRKMDSAVFPYVSWASLSSIQSRSSLN